MTSQRHEFEDKKFNGEKCAVCGTAIKGMFSKKAHQCRNCLKIVCLKCRKKPDADQGCGPPEGFGGAAAAPGAKDPVMDFYVKYVKRNAEGKMVVRGLPDEWKQLFKEAGVKPSELKDPQTAIWLINLMNDILAGKVSGGGGGGGAAGGSGAVKVEALYDFAAVQDGDLSFSKGSVIVVVEQYDNGWAKGTCNGLEGVFPFNYVKELPPEPSHAPPPPPPSAAGGGGGAPNNFPEPVFQHAPTDQAPPAPVMAAPVVDAPVAPPPPPMASGPKPPPPPAVGSKPPPGPPPPSGPKPVAGPAGGSRGGLLDQIAQGKQLRHVSEAEAEAQQKKELSELTGEERTNMLDIISNAMNARRAAVDDDEEDDSDDQWSD